MTLYAAAPHGGLGSWNPLWGMIAAYVVIVALLWAFGRGRKRGTLRDDAARIANSIERLTGLPGWAAAMVGTATFGLIVAGMGFYNDVAWHVGLGRDEELFTAPHTAIVLGLFTIAASSVLGVIFATWTRADVGLRVRDLRIPWAAVAMGVVGFSALLGFPLDELWHRAYGIDVTMWSPTHLLMIVGASISPLASLLALGETKVRAQDDRRVGVAYVVVSAAALLGLSSVQGEFEFGVPQFQQLYHPVLVSFAAAFAFSMLAVLVRRWWTPLIVGGISFVFASGLGGGDLTRPRASAIYLTSALGVGVVALAIGVDRKLRFAIASGVAVGTVGLAGEWLWSRGGYQPWTSALLPEGPVLAFIAAVAAAVLGVSFASAIRGEDLGVRRRGLALAGLALLVTFAIPLPRHGSDVTARVHLDREAREVIVNAQVSPRDAADDARWFQAIAWQGGGLQIAQMKPEGDGRFVSESSVPIGGRWKTMLRLHRGTEMGAVPIFLPSDPEIGEPEIPAADRTARFVNEQRYLLREQHSGPQIFAIAIFALLALISIVWVSAFVFAATKVRASRVAGDRELARV